MYAVMPIVILAYFTNGIRILIAKEHFTLWNRTFRRPIHHRPVGKSKTTLAVTQLCISGFSSLMLVMYYFGFMVTDDNAFTIWIVCMFGIGLIGQELADHYRRKAEAREPKR